MIIFHESLSNNCSIEAAQGKNFWYDGQTSSETLTHDLIKKIIFLGCYRGELLYIRFPIIKKTASLSTNNLKPFATLNINKKLKI